MDFPWMDAESVIKGSVEAWRAVRDLKALHDRLQTDYGRGFFASAWVSNA